MLSAPFTRAQARASGVSDRMLQGKRFVRVLPGVWAHRDLSLTWEKTKNAYEEVSNVNIRVTDLRFILR